MQAPKLLKRKKTKDDRKRVAELDFIRGICLILMMLYHLGVIAYFFLYIWEDFMPAGGAADRFTALFMRSTLESEFVEGVLHNLVIGIFFTVAGISSAFSRNVYKSFIKTLLFALGVTAASFLLSVTLGDESLTVTHGVFHMFAICYFAHTLFCLAVKNVKLRSALMLASAFFFFLLDSETQKGGIIWPDNIISAFFVERNNFLSSLDSFLLIPWIGWFFVGAALAPLLYPERTSLITRLRYKFQPPGQRLEKAENSENGFKKVLKKLAVSWHLPVSYIGRYPVRFYALHIVLGILFFIVFGLIFVPPGWLTAFFG